VSISSTNNSPVAENLFLASSSQPHIFAQTQPQPQAGIILIGQSKFSLPLVGHGQKLSDCGHVLRFKCSDLHAHKNTLLSEHHNHIAVRVLHKSCFRSECPTCLKKWQTRETNQIVHRFKKHQLKPEYQDKRRSHFVLSPSMDSLQKCQNITELRKEAQKQAKNHGLTGGLLIFHSKHKVCDICGGEINKQNQCFTCGAKQWTWQYYPHFHYVGYGHHTHEYKNKKESWFIRNLGEIYNLAGLIWYELGHCAHLGKKHIPCWFGCMSYNSFKCPKPETEPKNCPICGGKMRKFVSYGTFPKKEGVYYFTPEEFDKNMEPPPPEDLTASIDRLFPKQKSKVAI